MTGILWAALGVLGGLGMTAIGDMVSEEVRDRLDHLPHAILRLAARRLDPAQRVAVYEDEWLPELTYILKETRPITRLVHGTRFALGILLSAHRIAGCLDRAVTLDPYLIGTTIRVPGFRIKGLGIGDQIRVGDGPRYTLVRMQHTQRGYMGVLHRANEDGTLADDQRLADLLMSKRTIRVSVPR